MELITINTTNPAYSYTIGQRVGLSYMDIKKANYVYCRSNSSILFAALNFVNKFVFFQINVRVFYYLVNEMDT
jgi:hypothetical protein